jgi:phosphatidylserine/phosphatidylglycerophosphate/cardiolipin synthase-like enzyme
MGFKAVKVYANCDMTTIVWQTDARIQGCRGFAVLREVAGAEGAAGDDFVRTWVGFKGQQHKQGDSQPSTIWPVQRYIWSDYLVSEGQKVRYRVIPMIGPAGKLTKPPENQWSDWTDWIVVGTGQTEGFDAYFNRGIVPAQWLASQANSSKEFTAMLKANINDPKSKNRLFLSGPLRTEMLARLEEARRDGVEIYAALYELNDPELIDALKAIGANCHLVLGSGAYKAAKDGKPTVPDENVTVRKDLKKNSNIDVIDRIVKSPHFAHNKFVVFCDKDGSPATLWTGSTNWTVTGLCTQVNNGILIDSADLAAAYKTRWDALSKAGALYPPTLAKAGSTPATATVKKAKITAWNVPSLKFVDLNDASKLIAAAQDGVLFQMFNPSKGDGKKKAFALIQDILALDPAKLFIHGILNQDPGGNKAPLLQLTHKGKQLPTVRMDAILPRALGVATKNWFRREFTYNMVMIHSKVVLIDPFGKNPILMTGSHNMGPKASTSNDDNMVIIENAPGLAAEYAVNIMGVYGHYKWLYNEYLQTQKDDKAAKKGSPQYDGNMDDDTWQDWYSSGPNLREIEFWLS